MINSVNNNITTPAISFKGIVHIVPDKGKPELLTKVVNAAVKRLKEKVLPQLFMIFLQVLMY